MLLELLSPADGSVLSRLDLGPLLAKIDHYPSQLSILFTLFPQVPLSADWLPESALAAISTARGRLPEISEASGHLVTYDKPVEDLSPDEFKMIRESVSHMDYTRDDQSWVKFSVLVHEQNPDVTEIEHELADLATFAQTAKSVPGCLLRNLDYLDALPHDELVHPFIPVETAVAYSPAEESSSQ